MKLNTLKVVVCSSLLSVSAITNATPQEQIVDDGAYKTPAAEYFVEQIKKRQRNLKVDSVVLSAAGEPAWIDVGVVMHKDWIDTMSKPLTKDSNGRHYENGAQFAMQRVKAQFDFFNETLAMQNVNARIRPVYFSSVDFETTPIFSGAQFTDYTYVTLCTFYPSTHPSYNQSECEKRGLNRVGEIIKGRVDLVYYVREKSTSDTILGQGGFLSSALVLDEYSKTIATARGNNFEYTEQQLQDMRFGRTNADVFTHEFGHVFGAMHEVFDAEPANGEANRAYACGLRADGTPRVDNDLLSRRKTAMWHFGSSVTNPHHRFFSDEDIVVDGDRCGVRGEANNIDFVRKNAPLAAANYTLSPASSNVVFVQDAIIVGRAEGKATVTLRRTGDLTKPAYLTMTAKDGSAWENRDFSFGLKEIAFAAGEAEKTVDVTILPRDRGHADTKFSLVVQAAMGATYSATGAEITILSDKAIKAGAVQFDKASVDVVEGNTAQVLINRLDGTDGDITFKVTTSNGTAVSGTDYSAESTVKTLKDGEGSMLVTVATTKRAGVQGDRTVNLAITDVTGGAALGQIGQATLNIKDAVERGTLGFSAASATVNENGSITLTINRTNGTDGEVSVRVKTVNGTALAGTDFTAVDQVVTFGAGQSSANVTVAAINRTGTQGSRDFDVQLSDATGGAVVGGTATVRVTVQDVTPATTPDAGSGGGSGGSMGVFSLFGLLVLVARKFKLTK